MPTQPRSSAATDERATPMRWSSLALYAFAASTLLLLLGCEEERRRPPPADPAAAVAVADGPDPVLERWDLVGENPKFVPLKQLFAAYEDAKFEELANPMLSNLVDFAERPVIEQRPAELGPSVAETGPATDVQPENLDDVRTKDPLSSYRLIILMTGISRPKAVVTDGKMNRIVLERGDPLGSEGGRVRAILQYKVLIGMPGKADPVELSIEPPLASLVNEGAPATERKDL